MPSLLALQGYLLLASGLAQRVATEGQAFPREVPIRRLLSNQ